MIKRKRILITTFGSYGDMHPYMAIANELRARGHQPVIATSELYREKISLAGFEFVPMRPHIAPPQEQDEEMMAQVMNPRTGSGYLLNEMLFPFVREAYEDLLGAVDSADLLLTHPISFSNNWCPLGIVGAGSRFIHVGLRPTDAPILALDAARGIVRAARYRSILQAGQESL
jgi:UDP:flavonoid glycosyltransferase YjiC (YdhE family)